MRAGINRAHVHESSRMSEARFDLRFSVSTSTKEETLKE
jgi:hypothetical protein